MHARVGAVEVRHGSLITDGSAVLPGQQLVELGGFGERVCAPWVAASPVVQRHADPVDGIVAGVVGGIRVVRHPEHAVAVRVERLVVGCVAHDRVVATGERIPAAIVGRPDGRRRRRGAVHRSRDCGRWRHTPPVAGSTDTRSRSSRARTAGRSALPLGCNGPAARRARRRTNRSPNRARRSVRG